MEMVSKAFFIKVFGAKYERLTRTLFVDCIIFMGLYIADFRIQIAPFVLYLMVTAVTAGVMWEALSSKDRAADLQHMMMLPLKERDFIFSYTAVLGMYSFLTRTATLLAVLLAVSVWSWMEVLGSLLCAVNAVLLASVIFTRKKYRFAGCIWMVGILAAVFCLGNGPWFILLMTGNGVFAVLLLLNTDGYAFYCQENERKWATRGRRQHSVWLYFFRYLRTHHNYMMNMVIMWCVACVLPLFLERMESLLMLPIGFAILSMNTPICILLSCDPDFEQAIRFLPDQKRTFCVPYCLFIFLCNMIANGIFLCSMQMQIGGITVRMIAIAVFFALQSAIGSVLLEWFYPIRGWKIESDLWHHPRKYVVPIAMLFLAVVVGTIPAIVYVLMVLLGIEIVVLAILCRKC